MFGVNGRLDESVAAALDCDYGTNERKLVRQASPFNGICEPIVGTPRDAIRGFGAGLDVLVLDRFVLTK